ncbi:hypothetical protein A0H81_10754 [Grifola frondosa]|uniref:Uncharacterized protein n=1 Tax=Grifola frondosa TaxID=5627 RepID=A0A1C7LYC4_GRIFR|nr:hypothetical protein A0H81_10754 [Grifola frondosa]
MFIPSATSVQSQLQADPITHISPIGRHPPVPKYPTQRSFAFTDAVTIPVHYPGIHTRTALRDTPNRVHSPRPRTCATQIPPTYARLSGPV